MGKINRNLRTSRFSIRLNVFIAFLAITLFTGSAGIQTIAFAGTTAPTPLISNGQAVDWWFVFKFNGASFPECGNQEKQNCIFGSGTPQDYRGGYSQQYVYASSANPTLQKGKGCAGDTLSDPIGATFNQVYNGSYYYVVWNDQFYNDPKIKGCEKFCSSPWGHSKGVVAWDDDGEGFVMQVTTPSWPASGSSKHTRKTDGNTLGCVKDDDVQVSQHFFSLKLRKDDLVKVLKALQNASVVTDPTNLQIVNNGGPADVQSLVNSLGVKLESTTPTKETLSTGVKLISKPSELHVPPWQFVSALMGGTPLIAATWWADPKIPSTNADSKLACWDKSLGTPVAVQIATSGQWEGTTFDLTGGMGKKHNHAKFAVSTDPKIMLTIFGDMNQQGALYPHEDYHQQNCSSSQNGRGGTSYVIENAALTKSVTSLIQVPTVVSLLIPEFNFGIYSSYSAKPE